MTPDSREARSREIVEELRARMPREGSWGGKSDDDIACHIEALEAEIAERGERAKRLGMGQALRIQALDNANEKLKAEVAQLRTALHFGGHLRPDGSVCEYAGSEVCNKCGTTSAHFPAITALRSEIARLKSEGVRGWVVAEEQLTLSGGRRMFRFVDHDPGFEGPRPARLLMEDDDEDRS